MVKALGEQVSALFPQDKQTVDYQHKYNLLVAYIRGAADAVQGQDVAAETVMEMIQAYIDEQKL